MKRIVLTIIALATALTMSAKVTFAPHLTDHMVLQQKSEVELRGTATPGKTVSVTTSWDGIEKSVSAGIDGKWSVTVSTPSYGGPYTITAKDGKKSATTLSDILIGEVWILTGQSNMEMSVENNIIGMEEVMSSADKYSQIRLLHVENTIATSPTDEVNVRYGEWKVSSREWIHDFSAIGYLFGRELNENLNIPIGLIEDCWGGTLAEAWTSSEYLAQIPYFRKNLEFLETLSPDMAENGRMFEQNVREWNEQMKSFDEINESETYKVKVPGFLQQQGLPSTMGYSHLRKTVTIPASWAGKDLTLKVGAVDDNDCTFFNGVYLGHTEGCARQSIYTVPGKLVQAGEALIDIRMMDTGGMGGILGDDSNIRLEGPDGKAIVLTGEWLLNIGPGFAESPLFPLDVAHDANIPTGLYNAMIHPLTKFPIAGAIWYQGESNTSMAEQYRELLPLMITNWRNDWGRQFPFYICQIASYMDVQTEAETSEWAMLREAQAMTAANVENCGLACLIDVGEAGDIHPKNKTAPAHRLAINALAKTYGFETETSGPVFAGFIQKGSEVVISFEHAQSGLMAAGYAIEGNTPESTLKGFYIAGPDHVFYPAKAEIKGSTVTVSSDKVSCPTSVRYGWANNPVCNLYNGAGLPAVPFRTDMWEK